mgnify:FL=1
MEATTVTRNTLSSHTGYEPIKFVGTAANSTTSGAASSDWILMRAAEVYLNYAEAVAELGTITQNDLEISVNLIRKRAKMTGIDLTKADASPDPYLLECYPNVTKSAHTGVILEIRRERTIELLQEGHRYYDLIRWKEGKAFTQPLLGLYIPSKGEYDLDGDGTPDIYLKTKGETPSTKAPLIMEIDQDIFLSEGDHGYISPHKKNPGEWNEARDYYYPIPTDDRSLTGGALTQNPGWNDGLDF